MCKTDEEVGEHCMEFVLNVFVAGKAFGCGSSRAEAVMPLIGKMRLFLQKESSLWKA